MAINADEEDGSWIDDISGLLKSGTAAYTAYANRGSGGGSTPPGPSYVPQSGMSTNTMIMIGIAAAVVLTLIVLKKKG